MSRTNYRKLQRAITRDDKHSIESRWAYGRAILTDPKKMAASGKSLRNGAIEALIADAEAIGSKLTAREIQYRIQCARAYKSINELRTATFAIESWTDLRDAGFPTVAVDEPAQTTLFDQDAPEPRADFEQLGLFPAMVRNVPIEEATLAHLRTYARSMRNMTASYQRSDERRDAHLNELEAVCGGNLDVLYVVALDRLAASKPSNA